MKFCSQKFLKLTDLIFALHRRILEALYPWRLSVSGNSYKAAFIDEILKLINKI